MATGADPVRLPIEGATDSQLLYLRTFADSKAIIAKAASAKHVVVVGASFIGLEVAASLRTRGILVDVVAPDRQPLERVMGPEVGIFIRKLHEAHGVTFHLGETVSRVNGRTRHLNRRQHFGRRLPGPGSRRAAITGFGRTGRTRDRSRYRSQRVSGNQYCWNLRCRRCRALARSAHRRANSRRALGGS